VYRRELMWYRTGGKLLWYPLNTHKEEIHMANIFVKVAKLGSATKEFFIENGGTAVADALKLAGYASEGYDLRVNGSPATLTTVLRDGALITVVPKLKAGR
jgi:hypothetical protein